jgi:hypothetical protein
MVLDCSKIAFEIKFSRNSTVFRPKIVCCSQKSYDAVFAKRKNQRFLISYCVSVAYQGL